jgi:hypothetical protein
MENLSIGDTFTEAGYMSTSNDPEVAYGSFGGGVGGKLLAEDGQFGGSRYMSNNALGQGSVFWSIDLPVGSKAFGVPEGMGHQGESEDEVLLPRGSSVTVKSIRKVQQVDSDGNPVEDAFNYFLETELAPSVTPEVVEIVDETSKEGTTIPLWSPEYGNKIPTLYHGSGVDLKVGDIIDYESEWNPAKMGGIFSEEQDELDALGYATKKVLYEKFVFASDDFDYAADYAHTPRLNRFEDPEDAFVYEVEPLDPTSLQHLMVNEIGSPTGYRIVRKMDKSGAEIVEQDIPEYSFENSKTGWKYSDEHVVGIGGKDSPTDEELDAIDTYINNGYWQMNDVTRGYDPGDDPFSREDIDTYVENLTNLIDRNPPLGTTALVYRGVYDSVGMKWSELEVGDELIDRGFVSTTNSVPTARGFGNIQLEIELGEDTKLIDVSRTVEGTRVPVKESEIILQRGTKFEVVAKTENGLRLRVVGSDIYGVIDVVSEEAAESRKKGDENG